MISFFLYKTAKKVYGLRMPVNGFFPFGFVFILSPEGSRGVFRLIGTDCCSLAAPIEPRIRLGPELEPEPVPAGGLSVKLWLSLLLQHFSHSL